MPRFVFRLLALLIGVLPASLVSAAEVKVMISAGFFSVYAELGPTFEKSTGHKLVTTRGPSVGDLPGSNPDTAGTRRACGRRDHGRRWSGHP